MDTPDDWDLANTGAGAWFKALWTGSALPPLASHHSVSCLICGYHASATDESGTGVGPSLLSRLYALHACTPLP